LIHGTIYHPQTDGKTEIMNKWIEGYLRNYVLGQHRAWIKWFHLREHCYNTIDHMSIEMSPFRALYGCDDPSFMDLEFRERRAPRTNIGCRRHMTS
jgi:hypothetical protein